MALPDMLPAPKKPRQDNSSSLTIDSKSRPFLDQVVDQMIARLNEGFTPVVEVSCTFSGEIRYHNINLMKGATGIVRRIKEVKNGYTAPRTVLVSVEWMPGAKKVYSVFDTPYGLTLVGYLPPPDKDQLHFEF